MDEIKKLQEENKKLQEENKRLRKFKEREEEECGASAVMNDFMDRIQELEKENKEIKDRNNKQQVVIVNETIEKEKAQYALAAACGRGWIEPSEIDDALDTIENDFIRQEDQEDWERFREDTFTY
tara:strand:+ start:151 stop:525 length:375 start_codon:yes stop_codon:yes gene_type:complete